jgi:predicted DNA-binding protein (MmcQ/YjbR family)
LNLIRVMPAKGWVMTTEQFNSFCEALPHTTHVVQWGGAHVWKVGGKVFAIGGWNEGQRLSVSYKCSPLTFEMLKDAPGMRPAPYLASRGMTWLQHTSTRSLSDADLKEAVCESHRIVSLGLPKAIQKQLGLNQSLEPTQPMTTQAAPRRTAKSPRGQP